MSDKSSIESEYWGDCVTSTALLCRWRKLFTELGCPDVTDGRLFSETGAFCRLSDSDDDVHEIREVQDESRFRVKMSGPSKDLPMSDYPTKIARPKEAVNE